MSLGRVSPVSLNCPILFSHHPIPTPTSRWHFALLFYRNTFVLIFDRDQPLIANSVSLSFSMRFCSFYCRLS